MNHRRYSAIATLAAAALALAGCGGSSSGKAQHYSVSAARSQFKATCGLCHTLADAQTNGSVGPNLDQLGPPYVTVYAQINEGGGGMPAGLLHGKDAQAVATYVASHTSAAAGDEN